MLSLKHRVSEARQLSLESRIGSGPDDMYHLLWSRARDSSLALMNKYQARGGSLTQYCTSESSCHDQRRD